jgi:hypothetical protein
VRRIENNLELVPGCPLCSITVHGLGDRRVYTFESAIGLRCVFMIVGDDFVFFGDNTTYVVHS